MEIAAIFAEEYLNGNPWNAKSKSNCPLESLNSPTQEHKELSIGRLLRNMLKRREPQSIAETISTRVESEVKDNILTYEKDSLQFFHTNKITESYQGSCIFSTELRLRGGGSSFSTTKHVRFSNLPQQDDSKHQITHSIKERLIETPHGPVTVDKDVHIQDNHYNATKHVRFTNLPTRDVPCSYTARSYQEKMIETPRGPITISNDEHLQNAYSRIGKHVRFIHLPTRDRLCICSPSLMHKKEVETPYGPVRVNEDISLKPKNTYPCGHVRFENVPTRDSICSCSARLQHAREVETPLGPIIISDDVHLRGGASPLTARQARLAALPKLIIPDGRGERRFSPISPRKVIQQKATTTTTTTTTKTKKMVRFLQPTENDIIIIKSEDVTVIDSNSQSPSSSLSSFSGNESPSWEPDPRFRNFHKQKPGLNIGLQQTRERQTRLTSYSDNDSSWDPDPRFRNYQQQQPGVDIALPQPREQHIRLTSSSDNNSSWEPDPRFRPFRQQQPELDIALPQTREQHIRHTSYPDTATSWDPDPRFRNFRNQQPEPSLPQEPTRQRQIRFIEPPIPGYRCNRRVPRTETEVFYDAQLAVESDSLVCESDSDWDDERRIRKGKFGRFVRWVWRKLMRRGDDDDEDVLDTSEEEDLWG